MENKIKSEGQFIEAVAFRQKLIEKQEKDTISVVEGWCLTSITITMRNYLASIVGEGEWKFNIGPIVQSEKE